MSDNIQESGETAGTSAKEKLANLSQYMPNEPEFVYDFAKFLAARMKEGESDKAASEIFSIRAKLAIFSLQNGMDGHTNGLTRQTSIVYDTLRMKISKIAEAIFGEEYRKQRRKPLGLPKEAKE
ncbi:MAG: hypothetical protein K9L85_03285 [Candidatus Peribacteraceae bacterium]|nr:hypothetical protein [Candidatus Peribacteraceae bacterium]